MALRFKPGRYYKHTSGSMIKTLVIVDTTMWGKTLVAERAEHHNHDVTVVGTDDDGYAQNWVEITEDEWMTNFENIEYVHSTKDVKTTTILNPEDTTTK